VQFFWVVVKPQCRVFDADCNNSNVAPTERIHDVDSPFSVDPEMGILPASATYSFTITFAPSLVNTSLMFDNLSPYANKTDLGVF